MLATPLGAAGARAARLTVQAISADGAALRLLVPIERPARLVLPAAATPAAEPRDTCPAAEPRDTRPAAEPRTAATAPPPPPPPPSAADERRRIHAHCDIADLRDDGTLTVSGWAVSAVSISTISLRLNDTPLGEAETGLARPDVGEAFPTVPMARFAGFAFTTRVPLPLPPDCQLGLQIRNGLDEQAETWVTPERIAFAPAAATTVAAPADPARFRLEIDRPTVTNGAMVEPVSSRLTIEGWAVGRAGIAGLTVQLDGQRLGDAHYGLVRQDVERALPDWPNALRSGYAFHCPPRLLRNGEHQIELTLRAEDGTSLTRSFRFNVQRGDATEEGATIRRRIDHAEAAALARTCARLGTWPSFRLLIRGADPAAPAALRASLASLDRQRGPVWRADLLAADARAAARLRRWLAQAGRTEQVSVLNAGGAAGALPWPPEPGPAEMLCGVLAAGDELDPAALAEFALAGALDRDADFLYADEARISPVSREREPFFKPDFTPTLLLAGNYIGHPWFATAGLLRRVGATARGLRAAGEYDLVLRATEQARAVRHLPKLLCRRGPETLDDPAVERAALAAAARRRGIAAEVQAGRAPGAWRVRRAATATGLVSIIIPTNGAARHIETCITTLRARTSYRNFEIVCIENIPDSRAEKRAFVQANADRVVAAPAAFNWSRFNNLAAAQARGEYLLFLNDDIEVEQEDWLEAMLEHLADPAVGVVGARLLYPDRSVQHAGMFLAGAGTGRHIFRFAAADDPGYFGLSLTERETSAVTGACMLMRRTHFDALGGFDEAHDVINNDLDFCLRTTEAGRRIVYTPHACLIHHELASRSGLPESFDLSAFERRWRGRFAAGDPYHNPNLSSEHDDCRPNDELLRVVYGSGPRLDLSEIRRILVVKVDHIGDFVTSLSAIRHLKSSFPDASVHVMVSPAAAAIAALEPAIAGVIPFSFFHARSSLGEVGLQQTALEALRARLAPYSFDLAIDLRKSPDTRELLHCAGAKWLAGFDHRGQFPWLDISLEWEGDTSLHRKRSNVVDDLINLVQCVGASCAYENRALALPDVSARTWRDSVGPDVLSLFARPVVAVHPGVGNEMRQWPAGHFAALIDLITINTTVNVVLIGGSDEAELVQTVQDGVLNPDRITSVAGKIPLTALPGLLTSCVLYIGNNSGPKHIAAALGVPTIGIHSGVVDATEWGPVGPDALAIQRDMSCSPCYVARREDCPRALACLRQIDPAAVYRLCRPVLAAVAATPDATPASGSNRVRRDTAARRTVATKAPRRTVRP